MGFFPLSFSPHHSATYITSYKGPNNVKVISECLYWNINSSTRSLNIWFENLVIHQDSNNPDDGYHFSHHQFTRHYIDVVRRIQLLVTRVGFCFAENLERLQSRYCITFLKQIFQHENVIIPLRGPEKNI